MASKSKAGIERGCIENLLDVFAQATRAERQKGLLYYTAQRNRVEQLGITHGFTLDASAGAFAAPSPNKRENDTYSDLEICMSHVRSELTGKPRVCAYPRNRDKALHIFKGTEPQKVLRGSKVLSFYINTVDPSDPLWVTVDGHLVSAWVGLQLRMKEAGINRREYNRIRQDVIRAAKLVGVVPCQFHSVIWVVRRRLNRHPDQFVFDF